MANKELMITLGLDSSTFTQKVKKAKELNKELDKSFQLLSSSSKGFENTIQGLSKKQEYLNKKMQLASEEADIYAERLSECQLALEKSQKEAKTYAEQLTKLKKQQEAIGKALGTSSKEYGAISEKVKATTQLLDKANKAWITNDKRVTDASIGYKNAQIAVQEFGREAILASEKMSAMKADEEMKNLSDAIGESQRSFENMKNSVVGFDNTMEGLDKTQTHYTTQVEKMNELINKQKSELSASQKVLTDYENELSRLNIEMAEYEEVMESMDGTETMFHEVRAQVEALRLEYSGLNKTVEFHRERVSTLSNDYKSNETTLAKFNQSLDASTKKMVEMNKSVSFEPISKKIKELTNSDITKLEEKLSQLDNKFDIVATSVGDLEGTISGLIIKESHFNKTLEVSKKILSEYKTELTSIKSETQKLTNEQKELEQEITKQISQLKNLKGAEWDKQAESINKLKARYDEVNKSLDLHNKRVKTLESGYNSSAKNVAQLTSELEKTKGEIENLNRASKFDILDKNIKSVNSEIKKLEDAFNVAKSEVINFDRTKQSLVKTTELYTQKLELLKNQMNNYKLLMDVNSKEIAKLNKEQKELGKSCDELKVKLLSLDKSSPEYDETIIKIASLESKMKEVRIEAERLADSNDELQSELSQTTIETNELTLAQNRLSVEFKSNRLQNLGSKFSSIGNGISALGSSLMGVTYGAVGAMTAIGKTGMEFNAQMSKVAALTGETGDKLEETMTILEEGARKLAETSKYSATEMAQGLEDMVLAGYSATESVRTLPLVMEFAQAGTIELAVATEDLITSLNSLGHNSELTGDDFQNMTVMANQLAITANYTTTDLHGLARSFVKVGGQVENLKIPLSTANTMLGILGDKGVFAEEAGNALSSVFINLTQASGQSAKAMEELGISAFDANGNIKPMEKTLAEIKKKMESFDGDKQEVLLTNMLGGKTQAKTLMKLLQGIDSQTGDFTERYKNLKTELEGQIDFSQLENGTTALSAMAEAMNDNLKGDIDELTSAIEEGVISIFERYEPQIREYVQKITQAILDITKKIKELTPAQLEMIGSIAKWSVVAPIALKGIGMLTSGFGGLMTNTGKAFKLFKDTKSVVDAGKALKGVSTASNLVGKAMLVMGVSISTSAVVITTAIAVLTGLAIAIGENENALSWLQDKWGTFGEVVGGICEHLNGWFTLAFGNLAHLLGGVGKSLGAILTGKWRDIDDIWRETWAKMENTTAKAVSNIAMESTKAISTIRTSSQEELSEIEENFETVYSNISNLTKDNHKDVAKNLVEVTGGLSDKALLIMRGTSDTMAVLFENIFSHHTPEQKLKQLEKNLKAMASSGKYSADKIKEDFEKAFTLIENNASTSSKRVGEEVKTITGHISRFAQDGVEGVAKNISGTLKDMNEDTFSTLKNLGENWQTLFNGVELGSKNNTSVILENLNKMGTNTTEIIDALNKELQAGFDETGKKIAETTELVDGTTKTTSEAFATMVDSIKNNSNTGMSDVANIFAEGLKTLDGETILSLTKTSDQWYSILHGAVDSSGNLVDNLAQQILWNLGWVSEQSPETLEGFKDGLLQALVDANLITEGEMQVIVDTITEKTQEVVDNAEGTGEELKDNITPEGTAEKVKQELDAVTESYQEKSKEISEASAQAGEEAQKKFDEKVSQLGKDVQVDDNIINVENLGTQFQNAGTLAVQNFIIGWSNNKELITEALDLALSTITNDLSSKFEVLNLNIDGVVQKIVILSDNVTKLKDNVSLLDGTQLAQLNSSINTVHESIKLVLNSTLEAKTEVSTLGKTSTKNLTNDLNNTSKKLVEVKNNTTKASTEVQNLNKKNVNKVTEQVNKLKSSIDKTKDSLVKLIDELDKLLGKSFSKIHSRIEGISSRISTAIDRSATLKSRLNELNYISFDTLINRLSSISSWLSSVKNSAKNTSYAIQEVKKPKLINLDDVNVESSIGADYLSNIYTRAPFDINNYKTSGGLYNSATTESYDIKSNARNNNNDLLLEALLQQNQLLQQLLKTSTINVGVNLDGREVARSTARFMDTEINKINKRKNRLGGLAY